MENQSIPARILLYSTAAVILTIGMREIASILTTFFFSVFIALIFTPFIRWLKQKGIPGVLSVFLVILLFAFIVLILGVMVASAAIQFGSQIPIYQDQLIEFMAFFLGYIPYIGLALTTIPPAFFGLLQYGLVGALAVIIAISIVNALTENVIFPSLAGKGLKLSPAIVFLSLLYWNYVLGATGMLLATPLTMILTAFCFATLGTLFAAYPTENVGEVMSMLNTVRLPLIFISGVFIPISTLFLI